MDLSSIDLNAPNLSKKYTEHRVFDQLKDHINFYDMLSFTSMGNLTSGLIGVINFNTNMFSSMKGTLDSIKLVLSNGRINDAYALLRKYYDSTIINIYTNLYIEENCTLENYIVDKIQSWINGTEKIPHYRVISQYIKESERLKTITELITKNENYNNIRNRCNDHIHYNYFHNVIYNDNQIYLKKREKYLDIFFSDLVDLFIQHFSYLFYLLDHYMSSTDYVDYLDSDMTPPEGSQYCVATFIQEAFDKWVKPYRPDLAKAIKDNTFMELE